MDTKVKSEIFGGTHFRKAINDPAFFDKLPQFRTIQAKIKASHIDVKSSKGCAPCRQKRLQSNLERDFAAIASSLDPASGRIFKDYFGVSRMVIHAVHPVTKNAYLKEI